MTFKIKTILLLIVLPSISYCQKNSTAALFLNKKLSANANAIVRLHEVTLDINKIDELVTTERRIVTVLNKTGLRNVKSYVHYDKGTKVLKLKATVYNKLGNSIKKFSKSKFKDVSATDGSTMASDDRIKYIEYTPNTYPITIEFECQTKSNTTGFIPTWRPIEGWHISVEKNILTINNPKKLPLRSKEKNFSSFTIKSNKTAHQLVYEIANQPAIRYEKYAPNFNKLFPNVMFGLDAFSLKGEKGHAANWNEFAKWEYDVLLKEKNNLSEATKKHIQQKTAHIKDTLEKAKFVYNYMQNKTRYISIQYGIGGLSPEFAANVDDLGYGDCKGLTNYTKALLEAVGIQSYYTEIYAKEKRNIEKDFHSVQGNHIILYLPFQGKDYWMECTSQKAPFNFLGDFTDDRDALVLTPNGGYIKHTTVYPDINNKQITKAAVTINEEGDLTSNMKIKTTGLQYDNRYFIKELDAKEQHKYYMSHYWKTINNLNIKNKEFENDKSNFKFTESITCTINSYATMAGNDMLFAPNVFNKNIEIAPNIVNRKLPIEVTKGYNDIDTITYTLPKNYQYDYLPEQQVIESDFGKYEISFKKIDENHFSYHRAVYIKEGIFPKEKYKEYKNFLKSIAKTDNLKIVISKKQL